MDNVHCDTVAVTFVQTRHINEALIKQNADRIKNIFNEI